MPVEKFTHGFKPRKLLSELKAYYADTSNTLLAVPLASDQMHQREEAMMGSDGSNIKDRIVNGKRKINYLASSDDRYGKFAFKWDSYAAIGIDSKSNRVDQAAIHCLTLEESRDRRTGFLPVKFPMPGMSYEEAWPESTTNMQEGRTSYSQPSLTGWAVWNTYEGFLNEGRADEGKIFLEKMYGTAEPGNFTGLRGEAAYFINHRQNSPFDPLLFNIDPNETGRDFDKAMAGPNKYPVPGKGKVVYAINDAASWVQTQIRRRKMAKLGLDQGAEDAGLERDLRRSDWLPEQVRKKYAVNDAMFNTMHVMHLRFTAKAARELAKQFPEDTEKYTTEAQMVDDYAEIVEEAILTQMWNPQEKFFFNIDARKGKQITVKSITGLFPLLLKGIHDEQITVLLDRLEDPQWFGTPYPIPSHPVCSQFYDPHYERREGPDWQGPVWGITNYFLVEEGLVKQAERLLASASPKDKRIGKRCMEVAKRIVAKSYELLAQNDEIYEHYDPETGQGQRVKGLTWSNLMLHFDNYNEAARRYPFTLTA